MANYYDILGVSKDASQDDIRRAFRQEARKRHPDVNRDDPTAEARFKELNEAYGVLSDPDSRKKYDAYGDRWEMADEIESRRAAAQAASRAGATRRGGFGGGAYDVHGGGFGAGRYADLSDLLSDWDDIGDIGRRMAGGVTRRETEVEVSLSDAFTGATFNVTLAVGSTGERRFEVTVPPGVDNGSKVSVKPDANTEILLRVSVKPDPRFRRDGADLYTDADIPFERAILGGEAQVETIDGRTIWVKIPELSQSGQNIRLRGQGMPRLGDPNARGDLYVTVTPKMPQSLTDEQRDLIRQYADTRRI